MRKRPCLSQLTINQLHVWMIRGLGVWRSFDTAPNAVHEQYSAFRNFFRKLLFDFKKSISGPIELKFSGKTLNAIL